MNLDPGHAAIARRKPVPRGIANDGPAILSYGFRPFFLLAGVFAVVSMGVWIGALTLGWEIGGDYGALNWHAHEMLFGYTSAVLAGFILTAVPNWTGRFPVSGIPLLGLVLVWSFGRVVMAVPALVGVPVSALLDACFLPLMAIVVGTEIVAGKNWKNLKILAGLIALSLANVAFHLFVAFSGSAIELSPFAVGIYVMLIAIIGGRIVPSFTRNWLAKAKSPKLPAPFGPFDVFALTWLLLALILWATLREGPVTAVAALVAALLHAVRLSRWRGWRTVDEPLLLVLHIAYAFVPLGMVAVGLAAMGWVASASALHVLTVGAIGNMTLAMMTRVSLGHTGRVQTASLPTALAYLALALSAVVRPFAEVVPSQYHLLLSLSGLCWLLAFGLFILEYGPILVSQTVNARQA